MGVILTKKRPWWGVMSKDCNIKVGFLKLALYNAPSWHIADRRAMGDFTLVAVSGVRQPKELV